jgi:hypothetical protein
MEPMGPQNRYGGKAFSAFLVRKGERLPVVAKLWDGYKSSDTERNNEVAIYMTLQTLWRKHIPRLIWSGDVEFLWGIILEKIDVIPFHKNTTVL